MNAALFSVRITIDLITAYGYERNLYVIYTGKKKFRSYSEEMLINISLRVQIHLMTYVKDDTLESITYLYIKW